MAQRNSSKRLHADVDDSDELSSKRHRVSTGAQLTRPVSTLGSRGATADINAIGGDSFGAIYGGIVGGRNNTNNYTVYMTPHTQAKVPEALTQATAHSAFHNSAARGDPPKCHPNTRLAIQKKIMKWIRGLDPETKEFPVLWLYGPAGSGKTAIAQTIAEMLDELNMLLASFFFARLDPSRNCSRFLVATIAYQIALCLPDEVAGRIYAAISRNPHVFQLSLQAQIACVLLEPLQSLLASGYFVDCNARMVIIDGLDECIDRNEQEEILRSLSTALLKHRLPICFLIASRPELEIKNVFNSKTMKGVSTRLALENDYQASSDIKLFLSDKFKQIKQTHMLRDHLPKEWPTYGTILRLVEKSSGQFIYASTVVKFVRSPRHRPDQRLHTVLGLRPPGKELPFADLDALYRHLFSSVDDWKKVSLILAFCILRTDSSKFSVDVIEAVLCLEPGDCRLLLCDLGSIIDVNETPFWEKKAGLKFYHASLQDFLLDEARSKEFHIDPATGHARLIRVFSQTIGPREWKVAGMDSIDLTILRPHIEPAHGSQNLEAEILGFDFLRFLDHDFPPHVAYSIPDYLSIIKHSRLEGATAIYQKQKCAFHDHLKKELRGYGEAPLADLLLLCIWRDDFFGAHGLILTYKGETLRIFPSIRDSLRVETAWTKARFSYIQAIKVAAQEIISEQSERQTVTSAALYALMEVSVILTQKRTADPSWSIIWEKKFFFTESCKHLLEKAAWSEDLVKHARDLPLPFILEHHPLIFPGIDAAIHNYLTRMGVDSKQDYTFLSCQTLTRLSNMGCGSRFGLWNSLIDAFNHLLKKAEKSVDLINNIQCFPMPFVLDRSPWAVELIDTAFEGYLRRMGIASQQDYAPLCRRALAKFSELREGECVLNHVDRSFRSLIQTCKYLMKNTSPSQEFIDVLQGFQRHFLSKPGYLNKTQLVELDILIYESFAGTNKACAVELDYISSAYAALELFYSMSATTKDDLSSHCGCDFEISCVVKHCRHMLENAGQSKRLIAYTPDSSHLLSCRPWFLHPHETQIVEDALEDYRKRMAADKSQPFAPSAVETWE